MRAHVSTPAIVVAVIVLSIGMTNLPGVEGARLTGFEKISNDRLEPTDLIDLLFTRDVDQIVRGLNDIKRTGYQRDLLSFLDDLWRVRIDEHPDLPWDVISHDVVRLEIGNILIQADNNGKFDADRESIQEFAFAKTEHGDADVAISAILTIALIERNDNVDKLFRVARDGRPRLFRPAVVGLAGMCSAEAELALEKLIDQERDADRREYILDVRQRHQSHRAYYCE